MSGYIDVLHTRAGATGRHLHVIGFPALAAFVNDTFIRAAFWQAGQDYEAAPKNYAKSPLMGKDASTGKTITDVTRVAQNGLKANRWYATMRP